MYRYVLVLLSLIFISSASLAAEKASEKSMADLEALTQKVNAKNTEFAQQLTQTQKQVEEARQKTATAQKAYDVAYNDWSNTAGGKWGLFQGQGDKELKKKLEDAKSKLDAAKKSQTDSQKQADGIRQSQAELMRESSKDSGNLKSQNKAVMTMITSQGLLTDFATLQAKIGDTDLALEKISSAYDKSLLGAYLKDKVGLLLNSQTMCEAAARCAVKDRKEVTAESIQKTLFPGTENSSRKGNLYDKSHSGSVKGTN